MDHFAVTFPDRFVSIPEFVKRSSLSRGTVYNMIAAGEIARPTRLTANRVAWPAKVVDAWFASKMEAA
jgi:predicted DNA-binding transcriptional regulator AlpA